MNQSILTHFNQTIWAMLIGTFLVKTTYFMSWPFLIAILNGKAGISPIDVGIILGVSAGLSSFLGLYVGYLSDKFGRKLLMLIGCLILASSFLILIFANNFWHFFIVMALMGIGSPALEVSTKATISDSLSDTKVREFALNIRYFLINVAGAIGALMGLWLGLKNPSGLFIATCIAYAFYLLWIFKLVSPPKNTQTGQLPDLSNVIGIIKNDTLFLYLLLANFLLLIVYSQFNSTLPQIMTLSLADKAVQLIVLLGVVNCATVVILQFPLLKLLEKFAIGRRAQIGIFLMLIPQFLFMMIDRQNLWAWGIVFFILSVGETILFPTININIDQLAKPELRGSYFGAGSLSQLGHSAGPILGGFMLSYYNDTAYFILTSLLCMVSIILYQGIYQRQIKAY